MAGSSIFAGAILYVGVCENFNSINSDLIHSTNVALLFVEDGNNLDPKQVSEIHKKDGEYRHDAEACCSLATR